MKINARELNDHLRRGLKPIYWISGDEIFFVNQTVKTILNAAKDQGFTEIERIPVNAQFHPERLYIETHDLSLFAKKRCLILDLENTLPSAKFTTALNALLKTSDPDLLLIIQSPKLTYSITQQEWFKTFDRIGIHIPIWPIASNQLPEWVRAQAQ
ncbi:MAG: hypothetical protein EBX40_02910, partial [Gammaproteobacteria bacterium]|nr:hypothetical protein [Gammaproteobacteria bacterium]